MRWLRWKKEKHNTWNKAKKKQSRSCRLTDSVVLLDIYRWRYTMADQTRGIKSDLFPPQRRDSFFKKSVGMIKKKDTSKQVGDEFKFSCSMSAGGSSSFIFITADGYWTHPERKRLSGTPRAFREQKRRVSMRATGPTSLLLCTQLCVLGRLKQHQKVITWSPKLSRKRSYYKQLFLLNFFLLLGRWI